MRRKGIKRGLEAGRVREDDGCYQLFNVILAKAGIPFRRDAAKLGPRVREDDSCYTRPVPGGTMFFPVCKPPDLQLEAGG